MFLTDIGLQNLLLGTNYLGKKHHKSSIHLKWFTDAAWRSAFMCYIFKTVQLMALFQFSYNTDQGN